MGESVLWGGLKVGYLTERGTCYLVEGTALHRWQYTFGSSDTIR
jgi:hypothetical protein